MKNLLLVVLLGCLSGCAHQYVMKLTNGVLIETPHKPELRGANYHYKDAHGDDQVIPQSRVMEIEPASMAKEEKEETEAKIAKTKKKHWYWPF